MDFPGHFSFLSHLGVSANFDWRIQKPESFWNTAGYSCSRKQQFLC